MFIEIKRRNNTIVEAAAAATVHQHHGKSRPYALIHVRKYTFTSAVALQHRLEKHSHTFTLMYTLRNHTGTHTLEGERVRIDEKTKTENCFNEKRSTHDIKVHTQLNR